MKGERMEREGESRRAPTRERRASRRLWLLGVVAALALLMAGVAGGVVWSERRVARQAGAPATSTVSASPPAAAKPEATRSETDSNEPIEVSLTPEAMQRAGIKTVAVRADVANAALTVPGTVAPNAYRETKVNSLVGGIVRSVRPELGTLVERGEPIAVIFSNELAEAQMRYLSMQAMLAADRQKLERTQKLTEIGAASRQELEEVTATHEARATEVAANRQRLVLYGLSTAQIAKLQDASHIVSEITVPTPLDGVVTSRSVNPGQVVNAGQELLMVTDLSTVWIIGDLYEKDFATVRVGTPATVTAQALGQRALKGRVAYIDPRVDQATRTAKVRVEVANPGGALRLGMFVQVAFESGGGERRLQIPRAAVQSVGERSVVYVRGEEEGRFIERVVKLGSVAGEYVQVVEGLKAGERVVTEGSFFLRAEAARTRSSG